MSPSKNLNELNFSNAILSLNDLFYEYVDLFLTLNIDNVGDLIRLINARDPLVIHEKELLEKVNCLKTLLTLQRASGITKKLQLEPIEFTTYKQNAYGIDLNSLKAIDCANNCGILLNHNPTQERNGLNGSLSGYSIFRLKELLETTGSKYLSLSDEDLEIVKQSINLYDEHIINVFNNEMKKGNTINPDKLFNLYLEEKVALFEAKKQLIIEALIYYSNKVGGDFVWGIYSSIQKNDLLKYALQPNNINIRNFINKLAPYFGIWELKDDAVAVEAVKKFVLASNWQ